MISEIETQYGKVRIKTVKTISGLKRTTIEYDDLAGLSKKYKIPLQIIHQNIIKNLD